jgi:heat shock protein HtpX
MWELIRDNKRKSFALFILMGLCLVILGYFIGVAYKPPDGGSYGVALALGIWFFLSLISYYAGDSIMLSVSGAREVTPDIHPQLFNVVDEMKIAASLPARPKIYIIDTPAPNAFATGRTPDKSAVAVTTGLLSKLNRDELQGVVAHETSHILNRDILFMTFAGVMLGGIVLISEIFLRGLWYSGGSSRRYRSGDSKGGGQAQAIIMIIAIVFAILAPILARLLYFAISRRREYLADASAVRLTRYPEGLASALEKISNSTEDMPGVTKATAPLYIANPLKEKGRKLSDLTSTHPPISERIRILRNISQGASLINYQEAFNRVAKQRSKVIPPSGMRDTTAIPLRGASSAAAKPDDKTRKRDLGDLVRAVNGFTFLACTCGLKVKVPPDFKLTSFPCPRCGHELAVPSPHLATVATAIGAISATPSAESQSPATYTRQGKGWESFACGCGKTLQLSPDFTGNKITCGNCGRETIIK